MAERQTCGIVLGGYFQKAPKLELTVCINLIEYKQTGHISEQFPS